MTNGNGRNGAHQLPQAIATRCSLRPNSKREKLLFALVEHTNKPVPIEDLARKVYGSARRTAPLHMVALGLGGRLRSRRTGYALSRQRKDGHVLYGLFRR